MSLCESCGYARRGKGTWCSLLKKFPPSVTICAHYWKCSNLHHRVSVTSNPCTSLAVVVDAYNPALRYDKWLVLDAYGTPRAAVSYQEVAERVARPELNDRVVHVCEVVAGTRRRVADHRIEDEECSSDDRVSLTEEGLRMAERIAAEDRSTVRIPPTSPMAKRVGLHLRVESSRCVDPAAVRELEDSADVLLGDEHA